MKVYNPQKKKLDPRTISGYFVGYAKWSKGYKFYCSSYHIRTVESRNVKFLKNNLISGRDQFHNIVSKKDHFDIQSSTSSRKMIVIYNTPQVQTGIEQPIIEVQQAANDNQEIPQAIDDNLVDPII